jgi:hypothetical protein
MPTCQHVQLALNATIHASSSSVSHTQLIHAWPTLHAKYSMHSTACTPRRHRPGTACTTLRSAPQAWRNMDYMWCCASSAVHAVLCKRCCASDYAHVVLCMQCIRCCACAAVNEKRGCACAAVHVVVSMRCCGFTNSESALFMQCCASGWCIQTALCVHDTPCTARRMHNDNPGLLNPQHRMHSTIVQVCMHNIH